MMMHVRFFEYPFSGEVSEVKRMNIKKKTAWLIITVGSRECQTALIIGKRSV